MKAGMVVAAQPEAVEAGAEVLAGGGNAVDAAVATALVQTVVDPLMCGIAGFGCMHVLDPRGPRHETLDFYARVPMAARPDMWADKLVGNPTTASASSCRIARTSSATARSLRP